MLQSMTSTSHQHFGPGIHIEIYRIRTEDLQIFNSKLKSKYLESISGDFSFSLSCLGARLDCEFWIFSNFMKMRCTKS